ncbi:hypothetical protein D922_03502 [Enterococcus faecalis 06-MB-DW-09]|nr:hypothetical protein D922_03502 [Enterococcus faecalis 06-MB-DW-09]
MLHLLKPVAARSAFFADKKKEPASGDWRDRSKNEKVLGLFVGMY